MLTCREVTELASHYVDGQMTTRQTLGFRLHLSLCKNCRRFISQFRTTISYVRLLPDQSSLSNEQADAIAERVVQKSRLANKNEE